jgi:hypothetical protein
MKALHISAAMTAGQRRSRSTAHASDAPTTTGVIERLSVRGRAAIIQGDSFMIDEIITIFGARDGGNWVCPSR